MVCANLVRYLRESVSKITPECLFLRRCTAKRILILVVMLLVATPANAQWWKPRKRPPRGVIVDIPFIRLEDMVPKPPHIDRRTPGYCFKIINHTPYTISFMWNSVSSMHINPNSQVLQQWPLNRQETLDFYYFI